MQELKQGTLLQGGKYIIKKKLGQGGFGITYLAEQVSLGREVAIKEFFMKDSCLRNEVTGQVTVPTTGSAGIVEQFRKKFLKEARTLASLDHPHIISVIDVFEENGTVYYSMPYFTNGSLKSLVKSNGRLSESEALRYIGQVASALFYMHGRFMCHYDVKPDNILIDAHNNAVLIDFGISKNYDDRGHETSTTPIGTSGGYAPIEQYQGISDFSPASDVYALGATLYYLLEGETPPTAPLRVQGNELSFDISISDQTRSLIEKAMHLPINKRPQDVREFINKKNDNFQSQNPSKDSKELDSHRCSTRGDGHEWYDEHEFQKIIKDESLPIPESIEIKLANPYSNRLSYIFDLSNDTCNNTIIDRNGDNVLEDEWPGGINQEIIDSLRRNGLFSKYHWEREDQVTAYEGIHVSCSFYYKNGTSFIRDVEFADSTIQKRLLHAVEAVVQETYLSGFLQQALRESRGYPFDKNRYGISIMTMQSSGSMRLYYRGWVYDISARVYYMLNSWKDIELSIQSLRDIHPINTTRIDYLDYIGNNKELLCGGYNIVTYITESDYLNIFRGLRKYKYNIYNFRRISHEMQLIPLCDRNLNTDEDISSVYMYQGLYSYSIIGDGIVEIQGAGSIDSFREIPDIINYNLTNEDSLAYLVTAATIQYKTILKLWDDSLLLLQAFPFSIKYKAGNDHDFNELITADTYIPARRSCVISNNSYRLLIDVCSKQFSVPLSDLFNYSPRSIDMTVEINASSLIIFRFIDKQKDTCVNLSLMDLLDYMIL